MSWTVLIDAVVLLGVAVVCPLALGHARWWIVACAGVLAAMLLPTGPAAAATAALWCLVALCVVAVRLRSATTVGGAPGPAPLDAVARLAAAAFSLVASGAFVASRGGIMLFGIAEPIVELTAVHFTYAGVGALTLSLELRDPGMARRAAVLLAVAAPPLIGLGFVTRHPVAQVGGAVLLSIAVYLTAMIQLREALAGATSRTLLGVSGLAPWIPMALAVAWAASNHWAVPALSIPDMVRTHGVMNVVFVVAGLLARRRPDGAVRPTRSGVLDAAVAR